MSKPFLLSVDLMTRWLNMKPIFVQDVLNFYFSFYLYFHFYFFYFFFSFYFILFILFYFLFFFFYFFFFVNTTKTSELSEQAFVVSCSSPINLNLLCQSYRPFCSACKY